MFYDGRFQSGSVSVMPGAEFATGFGHVYTGLAPRQLPVPLHYAQRPVNWQDVSSFIGTCASKDATGSHSLMQVTARRQPGNVGRDDVIWRTETGPTFSCCCVPTGCARYAEDRINPNEPGDSVKVNCTSPGCVVGRWMHSDCFDEWQRRTSYNMRCYEQEAGLLQSAPSARLVLAGQLSMCICGKGFLSRDLNYVSSVADTSKYLAQSGHYVQQAVPHRKEIEQRGSAQGLGLHQHLQQLLHHEDTQQQRMRSCSFSSTGSGSCSSASSSSVNCGSSSCGYSSTSASPPLSPPRSFFPPSNSSTSPPPGASNNGASMPSLRAVGFSKGDESELHSLFSHPPPTQPRLTPVASSNIPTKTNAPPAHHHHHHHHHHHRAHAAADDSLSTTLTSGDSQPEVDVTSPPQPNARGNIFQHRPDLSIYRSVIPSARNAYCIQLDDDGPHGNNDTRKFLMHKLTSRGVAAFQCVGCRRSLPVYDEFPVIDGTLFLSPRSYDVGSASMESSTRLSVQVVYNRRVLNLHAVCIDCLGQNVASDSARRQRSPSSVRCKSCRQPWMLGSALVLGTMYTYDVFASAPCCAERRCCRRCGQQPAADDPKSFSDYSKLSACRHCGLEDYHFVRNFDEVFYCVERSPSLIAKNADVISKRSS